MDDVEFNEPMGSDHGILCIDVGGTTIRASVFPERLDVATLPSAPQVIVRSLGWLNESLPNIISHVNSASVINQQTLVGSYDRIAICVPGPVVDGQFLRPDLPVPRDLFAAFSRVTDKRVTTLVNDANAWAIGAATYLTWRRGRLSFPLAALTLGTGVGLSIVADEVRVVSTELSRWRNGFPALERVAGRTIAQPWEVHDILGAPFFDWVKRDKQHWSYERIRTEFTNRVAALLHDILPALDRKAGPVNTLVFGGGNAEFVAGDELQEHRSRHVECLWRLPDEVNPDIIPLLGLHRLVTDAKVNHTADP